MLKRMSLKKILVCLIVLFSLGLLYILPNNKLNSNQKVEYIDETNNNSTVYLENKNHYLTRVSINIEDKNIETKAKELLKTLIIDDNDEIIPNGFQAIIPSNTKINSIKYKDNVIKVDFSDDLLNTTKDNEEKIIESIIYTLTSIKEVKFIIIYIDGEILTKLPKSNINLPSTLDRNFGINKKYNISSDKNITKTTIYYIENYNNKEYYIPVTNINNDSRDKIEVIIEELSNNIYNKDLTSYLNSNTKLLSSSIDNNNLSLVFNEYIFDDQDEQNILDEVITSICLSIKDNYDIETVSFNSNNKEINKTTLKSLE